MSINSRSFLPQFLWVLSCTLLLGSPLMAQEEQEKSPERAKVRTAVQLAPAEVQGKRANALREQIRQCGAPCMMGGSGSIAAAGGSTLDFNCDENGDCACFGAKDCVAMADVCKEGTMGCNKQGCVCEEG
jgi:hypothetical protein